MLVPTFVALPAVAADSENDALQETETQYVAEVYKPDGTLYDKVYFG